MALRIGQSNRPELVRQTLIPAFPPRGLGSDDAHTGRRRHRAGGAPVNISGASSILSQSTTGLASGRTTVEQLESELARNESRAQAAEKRLRPNASRVRPGRRRAHRVLGMGVLVDAEGKSFVDGLDNDLLIAKLVVLAATAGSSRHALVVDEQMRSLFAYMRALTLPTSVFAACGRSEVRAHVCWCRSPGNHGVSPDAGSCGAGVTWWMGDPRRRIGAVAASLRAAYGRLAQTYAGPLLTPSTDSAWMQDRRPLQKKQATPSRPGLTPAR